MLIDPDLEDSPERINLSGIPSDCISNADAVLITHEHGDHFNFSTVKRLVAESNCRFILPPSCLSQAQEAGIPSKRIIVAHHGKPIALFGDDFLVTPIPAIHGHILGSIYKHYNAADCGYFISAFGYRLFHPGDTVLLEEHFDLPKMDVLMVSPTEHNTHIRQSKVLVKRLNPRYILPQHRDTYHVTDENYFWTRAYEKELYDTLNGEHKARYHVLAQGQEFDIRQCEDSP